MADCKVFGVLCFFLGASLCVSLASQQCQVMCRVSALTDSLCSVECNATTGKVYNLYVTINNNLVLTQCSGPVAPNAHCVLKNQAGVYGARISTSSDLDSQVTMSFNSSFDPNTDECKSCMLHIAPDCTVRNEDAVCYSRSCNLTEDSCDRAHGTINPTRCKCDCSRNFYGDRCQFANEKPSTGDSSGTQTCTGKSPLFILSLLLLLMLS